jgi:hypothetical protein
VPLRINVSSALPSTLPGRTCRLATHRSGTELFTMRQNLYACLERVEVGGIIEEICVDLDRIARACLLAYTATSGRPQHGVVNGQP